MNYFKYLKDKVYIIITTIFFLTFITFFLIAFKTDKILIIVIITILFLLEIILMTVEYFRKKTFYNNIITNIKNLDKSYLVLETIKKPTFYEGEVVVSILNDINSSMIENVKSLELVVNDFKNYIEMWIHEVKTPLSTLTLISHNQNKHHKLINQELNKIEDYVNQVLYYVRCENSSIDYLIKEYPIKPIINSVLVKNKDLINNSNITIKTNILDIKLRTDAKWLEFIIGQILMNSIKYKKNNNSYISIEVSTLDDQAVIKILDNGIGIAKSDIDYVFDKSFTGINGRLVSKSTGMGLFIVKNLCLKLGHKIEISSVLGEYTCVSIYISLNDYITKK